MKTQYYILATVMDADAAPILEFLVLPWTYEDPDLDEDEWPVAHTLEQAADLLDTAFTEGSWSITALDVRKPSLVAITDSYTRWLESRKAEWKKEKELKDG